MTATITTRRRSSAIALSLAIVAAITLNTAAEDGAHVQHRSLRAHKGNAFMDKGSKIQRGLQNHDNDDNGNDVHEQAVVGIISESFGASNLIPVIPPRRTSDADGAAKDIEDSAVSERSIEPESDKTEEALPEKYIVGGSMANIAKYPFFAQMRGCDKVRGCYNQGGDYDWGGCGATLVSSRHILTAGHCVAQDVQNELDLRGFRIGGSEFVRVDWRDCTKHPRYDENRYDMPEFDIAIVELPQDVTSTPAYVDTGSFADNLLGETPIYTAIGHGKTSGGDFGRSSSTLLEADLFGLADDYCIQQYGSSYHTRDKSMLCAGQFNWSQDQTSTCNGDSGGPLLSMDANANLIAAGVDKPILVGVTSWGPDSCAGGVEEPSVFAKVGTTIEWFGPIVCNSFNYQEDQPDWCRVCDGVNSGWCRGVREAASRAPQQVQSASSSSTAAPQQSGSTTTSSSSNGNLGPTGDYTEACQSERRNMHCNYGNTNKPICSCGWMADMLGKKGADYRRQKCTNAKVKEACPNTCQERCNWRG